MLHEIGVELQAALAAKKCPFVVLDGPERRSATTFGRERIVIEHDEGGDTFGPSKSKNANPQTWATRYMGAKITIYAQNPVKGANEFEHKRRAEQVLDMIVVALTKIASKRRNEWRPKSGRFFIPDDLAGSERAAGAVYELKFSFDRGVTEYTWQGEALPQVTIGPDVTVASTYNVSSQGDPLATQTSVPPDAQQIP